MPFLPFLMAAAPLLGKIAGGAAGGSADQRYRENNQRLQAAQVNNAQNLQRAQLQSSDAMNRAGLDLQRKSFAQSEPSIQARQALVGSLLNRIQPLQLSGLSDRVASRMPQLNNSILSMIGPEARQAGSLLANRAVSGLQNPTQFSEIPALNLPPMEMAKLQQSGWLEKILGGVGLAGSVVGALGDLTSVTPQYEPNDENGFG